MKKGWDVAVFGVGLLLLGGCSGERGDPLDIDPLFSSEPNCPDQIAESEVYCDIYYQAMERVLRAAEDSPCGDSGLAYRDLLHDIVDFTFDLGYNAQVVWNPNGFLSEFHYSWFFWDDLLGMSQDLAVSTLTETMFHEGFHAFHGASASELFDEGEAHFHATFCTLATQQ